MKFNFLFASDQISTIRHNPNTAWWVINTMHSPHTVIVCYGAALLNKYYSRWRGTDYNVEASFYLFFYVTNWHCSQLLAHTFTQNTHTKSHLFMYSFSSSNFKYSFIHTYSNEVLSWVCLSLVIHPICQLLCFSMFNKLV